MSDVVVKADLDDTGARIELRFEGFDQHMVNLAKTIPGSRFVPPAKGGPMFVFKADIENARLMRKHFPDIAYTLRLRSWGQAVNRETIKLSKLAQAEDAELENMPNTLMELSEFINGIEVVDIMGKTHIPVQASDPSIVGRPYQRADIKFLAEAPNPFNANQPGLGKTVETIGAIFEEGIDEGPHLVIAPKTSLDVVWQTELEAWQPWPVLTAHPGGRPQLLRLIAQAEEYIEQEQPFWFVVNPDVVRYRRIRGAKGQQEVIVAEGVEITIDQEDKTLLVPQHPFFYNTQWNTITLDEFHKMGMGNDSSLTYKSLMDLTAIKKHALSGTPVGGKPIRVWGILHWLHPKEFSSKWRFADHWLEVTTEEYNTKNGVQKSKSIHGLRKEREEQFYEMLSRYMVRRTKGEVLTQLPPKQPVDIWLDMEPEQAAQYEQFALAAEIKIEDENLTAAGILAEYTRLKQFADAKCKIIGYTKEDRPIVQQTAISNKLPQVIRLLDELEEEEIPIVVFSQFSRMVDMVQAELDKLGYRTVKLTGDTKGEDRSRIVREFQDGKYQALIMTTTAGGVSITLDAADHCMFLDETWNPDDQEQASDRIHRGSRIHQVTVYYLRSRGTIEEYIHEVGIDKSEVNQKILDLHRKGFRAVQ